MATLALAVIAKDEIKQVKRIISDYEQYFDEIAIAYDNDIIPEEIGEISNKIHLHKYEWCNDFAHKRNFLAGKIRSDYYFRLDTDDEISLPEKIREAFNRYVMQGLTLVFLKYMYGFDEGGHCNAMHWRETIIKNDGNIFWNKPIHENTNPKFANKMRAAKEDQISIIHKTTPEEREKSTQRNLKILLEEIMKHDKEHKKQDPRTIGYVARMFLALKEYDKAVPYFEEFLRTSGWDDDKYFAWIQLSDCLMPLGLHDKALSCVVEALLSNPEYPDAYFHMMDIYFDMKEYNKAILWGSQGFSKKTPDTMMVIDPSSYTWRPAAQLGMCYMHVGRYKEAIKLLNKAYQLNPTAPNLKETLKEFTDIFADDEAIKGYVRLMNYTKYDLKKFRALLDSIPPQIGRDERILALKNMVLPPKVWDDKSVVFYCGGAWEDWVDSSVIGGIGGSEEATIYMSRELTKLGYKVTIFNQCGELAGTYNGIEYRPYYDFNRKDKFNVLISWRQNVRAKAKKKYIWMHDVPAPNQFSDDDLADITKIIVLSKYHRSLLTGVPDNKVLISRNGINAKDFLMLPEDRNPKRCIWTSSYDRGLEKFLEISWPQVLEKIPDAELHIFYGWNTYDEMTKQGVRSPVFKQKMVKLMGQKGVKEHGRIGHKKLAKELARSGIFSYPTTFEEISCISAMKAQAAGAVPVVNSYAALKETVKYGTHVSGNVKGDEIFTAYADALVYMMKDPDGQEKIRDEMMAKSVDLFSWEGVAKEWQKDLL